jgi:hypothetical protein
VIDVRIYIARSAEVIKADIRIERPDVRFRA